MTAKTSARAEAARSAARRASLEAQAQRLRRRRWLLWSGAITVVAVVLGVMAWTSRTTSDTTTRVAPDFTLSDTSGNSVHLADYRGRTVVLYFSEGAGCQSCLYQMADIEHHAADFAAANVVVLPIVMNSADEIRADMAANEVRTPFLVDASGAVSRAYGTLGKGMHAGLPGHSFVLVDPSGNQRWYGEYPSMYLSPADLLKQVRQHLT
jgi:peroxiredoxin